MAKSIELNFSGYWREVNKSGIPAEPGVYLVYVCRYDSLEKKVTLDKLLYIGESVDVCDRVANHEKWPEWRRHVPRGSQICFSFAGVINPDRQRAEAALIYHHKPPCNEEYTNSFPFADTTVASTGRCALLSSPIYVQGTKVLLSW